MTRERWILYGLIAAIGIVVILLITGVFGKRDQGNPYFDVLLKEKDARIEAEIRNRETLVELMQSHTAKIDSLTSKLADNQPKYIINERKLADVPARYVDVSKDDLRARATNY